MYAIEFEADVKNGMIKIPSHYKEFYNKQHIKIIALLNDAEKSASIEDEQPEAVQHYSDEYIQEHWQELIITGLQNYDDNYYKSEQYKIDRGTYLAEKYK